ncbi:hypothetical protein ES288_D03G019500v1 [Gossypium darwinii]|uniref:F-box associated domain-containing protein n=2 Tax=Gossypium TaxID=3633 RepID=A0A5D2LI34_GOSTO|nr:hypothetical protein ES288_D03G019500v1 [Gossypium darwinii]TYH78858.1 hypothetical protein ES332_D03G018700v1 [Gossypium tomentosum]
MASYDFSDEILFEIFLRAELKTMKKCRVLSKECKDLTYESSFMRLHSERTSTMVGYLVQCSRIFDPLPSEVVSIVNSGLDPNQLGIYLIFYPNLLGFHPVSKTSIWKTNISMLVLRSNPLRFKIVRLSDSRYDAVDLNTQDVSACGGLHWLMFNHEQDKYTILSFEGDKEERGMTSLPDSLGEKIVGIWIKKHTINLESFNEKVPHSRFHSFYGADTVFMVDVGWVSFYNFKTRKLNRIMVGGSIDSAYFIQTDSESVKLKPE